MGDFKRYVHVERLGTDECSGLLENNEVYVTAKVDGSNGSVWWNEEVQGLVCASRNMALTLDADNAEFCAWCSSRGAECDALRAFCRDYPHLIVYGEWMGRNKFIGAFKHYAPSSKGSLLIFDVYDRRAEEYLADSIWRPLLTEYHLDPWFIKVLAVLDHPSFEDVLELAKKNDFLLEGTGMVGEGVVCKAAGWRNAYGRQAYGKIVLDEFKSQAKPLREAVDVEQSIVDVYMTCAELEKTMAKVCAICNADEFDAGDRRMMGMMTNMCWRDLLDECSNWVKKFKKPCVDFAVLSGKCTLRIKEYLEQGR